MSSRVERMQALVELAVIDLDKAAQTFATLQGQYEHESSQLQSLQQYIDEYANESVNKSITMSVIELQTRHVFGEKLRQAVNSQLVKVEQLAETVEKGREMWIEKRVRVKALEALLSKIKKDIGLVQDRQEQRFLDELATQGVISRREKG